MELNKLEELLTNALKKEGKAEGLNVSEILSLVETNCNMLDNISKLINEKIDKICEESSELSRNYQKNAQKEIEKLLQELSKSKEKNGSNF